jgi:hypothetical protein
MRALLLMGALAMASLCSAQFEDDSSPEGEKQTITQADDDDESAG